MLKLARRQCLTTAPEDYDYGWARTLILNVATDSRGRSMRLVENQDDWHFNQQVMRYGSGLHLTIDRQIQLEELLEYGLLKLTDNPVHIHRRTFDFSDALGWPDERLTRLVETVEEIQAIDGLTLNSSNGGLCYSLEVRGDNDLFDQTVTQLAEFEADTGCVLNGKANSILRITAMDVHVIKHLRTGNVVAVIQSRPDVSQEQALVHWLASCGLTEKATSQFQCDNAPVIPWASLAKMFEPIAG